MSTCVCVCGGGGGLKPTAHHRAVGLAYQLCRTTLGLACVYFHADGDLSYALNLRHEPCLLVSRRRTSGCEPILHHRLRSQ